MATMIISNKYKTLALWQCGFFFFNTQGKLSDYMLYLDLLIPIELFKLMWRPSQNELKAGTVCSTWTKCMLLTAFISNGLGSGVSALSILALNLLEIQQLLPLHSMLLQTVTATLQYTVLPAASYLGLSYNKCP